jgi:riboflavin kinase/FMN adenylyltransferase
MKVLNHIRPLRSTKRPLVMAIGFFDGVHRGHRRVIGHAVRRARAMGGEAWVLSFERHPLEVLSPGSAPPLLTTNRHKSRLLEPLGVNGCVLMPFDRRIAAVSPEAFVRRLHRDAPALRVICVGEGWRFGRHGAGDTNRLAELARALGIQVKVVPPVNHGVEPISSTRIRRAVLAGRLDRAAALLGRPFSLLGTVVRGRQVGRTLGRPTANLRTANEVLPPPGVYAVRVRLGRRDRLGVANVGTRPTFFPDGRAAPVAVELHILDFRGDLYGRELEARFLSRIRGERRFASAAALQRRITRDVAEARLRFAEK